MIGVCNPDSRLRAPLPISFLRLNRPWVANGPWGKWSPSGGLPSQTCFFARCIAAWPNDDPRRGGPRNGHSPS
eukprot:11271388-Heterocapsa_arctica.AAC.1